MKRRANPGVVIGLLICCVFAFLSKNFNQPLINNFDALSKDYDAIVDLVSSYSVGKDMSNGHVTIIIRENSLIHNETEIEMTEEQKESLKVINENSYKEFDYIWASEEFVIFWEDETKYYGLLYSENPSDAIAGLNMNLEQNKVTDQWYEIGHFGR